MSTGPDLFVVCKSCGSEVSPYITECPYCGNRLRKRAPKLDRDGQPRDRKLRRQLAAKPARPAKPRLGRLRPGEMPGIRFDTRPYVTLGLLALSVAANLLWRAHAIHLEDIVVLGPIGHQPWRLVTSLFVYDNSGYGLVALLAVAIFGWLLERRHGWWAPLLVFLIAGAGGMAIAAEASATTVAVGANGAGLGLLGAWLLPDVQARRRGEETDSDLLGVAAIAAALLAMPLAVPEADPLAGIAGGAIGVLMGVPLARFAR
jgi:membrane associated rhomboid family serine protease